MSREIKFRAWDHEHSRWESPDGLTLNGVALWEYGDGHVDDRTQEDPGLELMQYTGLKDKSGVEIYEGDIVRVGTEYNNLSKKNGKPVYETVRMIHGAWEPLHIFRDQYFEVHGNIYEHPHLLEKSS